MGDQVNRLEADRSLYATGNRKQLIDLLKHANPFVVAGAIAKVLELQLVTEELANDQGLQIDDSSIEKYAIQNRERINKQLDLAINSFICSIVSQEG